MNRSSGAYPKQSSSNSSSSNKSKKGSKERDKRKSQSTDANIQQNLTDKTSPSKVCISI